MITIKLDIELKEQDKNMILKYQNQYSNLLHVYYNRLLDGISQTQCKHLELNNVELLGSWLRQSCVYEANSLIQKNKDGKVIFGGKSNFFKRMKKLISKDNLKKTDCLQYIASASQDAQEIDCSELQIIRLLDLIQDDLNHMRYILNAIQENTSHI